MSLLPAKTHSRKQNHTEYGMKQNCQSRQESIFVEGSVGRKQETMDSFDQSQI